MARYQGTREQIIEDCLKTYAEGAQFYTDLIPGMTMPSVERMRSGVTRLLDKIRWFEIVEGCHPGMSVYDNLKRLERRELRLARALRKIAKEAGTPDMRLFAREAVRWRDDE